jgi:hypothetical protein
LIAIDPLLPTRPPAVARYYAGVERLGWHLTRHPSAGSQKKDYEALIVSSTAAP